MFEKQFSSFFVRRMLQVNRHLYTIQCNQSNIFMSQSKERQNTYLCTALETSLWTATFLPCNA